MILDKLISNAMTGVPISNLNCIFTLNNGSRRDHNCTVDFDQNILLRLNQYNITAELL